MKKIRITEGMMEREREWARVSETVFFFALNQCFEVDGGEKGGVEMMLLLMMAVGREEGLDLEEGRRLVIIDCFLP